MFFKEAMENSGAVKNLSRFFIEAGNTRVPRSFSPAVRNRFNHRYYPGFCRKYVSAHYPYRRKYSVGAISFAFAAGFLGVLLSPVHVCLVLTREYFKADLWGMYKMMLPACVIIFAAAVIQYMLLS